MRQRGWSATPADACDSRRVPLRRPPHASLVALLSRELTRQEHPPTAALIRELAGARARGSFTRAEFKDCRWKSPPRAVICGGELGGAHPRGLAAVLATRSERRRMELLTGLRGVGVPMASAILTLLDPRRYGVLDIRAWQLLFAIRSVSANRAARASPIAQWEQYLDALRSPAARTTVAIEYTPEIQRT